MPSNPNKKNDKRNDYKYDRKGKKKKGRDKTAKAFDQFSDRLKEVHSKVAEFQRPLEDAFYDVAGFVDEMRDRALNTIKPKNIYNKASKLGKHLEERTNDMVNKVKDFFSIGTGKNHPTWYTKGNRNAIPAGLNYNINKDAVIEVMNSQSGFSSDTTIPLTAAMRCFCGTYSAYGDDSAWLSSMQRITAQLMSNSGRVSSYSHYDVGYYVYNISVVYATLTYITRCFQLCFNAERLNASVPESFARSCGFNLNNWTKNSAEIRETLKIMWKRVFEAYPLVGTVADRWAWLFGNVFADYNGPKATYIVPSIFAPTIYNPANQEKFQLADQVFVSPTLTENAGSTWESVSTKLNGMLTVLANWYAGSQIVSDFQRVFGYNDTLYSRAMDIVHAPSPAIIPIIDAYMLRQLQNARTINSQYVCNGSIYGHDSFSLAIDSQSHGMRIRSVPSIKNAAADNIYYRVANAVNETFYVNGADTDLNSVGEQLSLTRLIPVVSADINQTKVMAFGTEVPISLYYIVREEDNSWAAQGIQSIAGVLASDSPSLGQMAYMLRKATDYMALIQDVDYHPITYFFGGEPGNVSVRPCWDFDLYATLTKEQLIATHDACIFSLYYVEPQWENNQHLYGFPSV